MDSYVEYEPGHPLKINTLTQNNFLICFKQTYFIFTFYRTKYINTGWYKDGIENYFSLVRHENSLFYMGKAVTPGDFSKTICFKRLLVAF